MDYGTLAKLATRTVFTIDMKGMSPRVNNALLRAVDTGFLNVNAGLTADYFHTIADKFRLPYIRMSERSQYGRGFTMHRVPVDAELALRLNEWWDADRVAFRMSNPEEWNRYEEYRNNSWYGNYVRKPDWRFYFNEPHKYVPILDEKNADVIRHIAAAFVNTPQYQEAAARARTLIQDRGSFEVAYVRK